MSRNVDFTLKEEEVSEIEWAMNHSDLPEVRQRAAAIHMLHLGDHPTAVAQRLAVAASTIWNWHRRWRKDGIAGLANQAKSGRPAKATQAYLQALDKAIETDPRELGYAFSVWTINKLRHHLAQETGILLSYSRMRALLSKQGYVYKQPKHDLRHLQDDDDRQKAEDWLDWMKKSPSPKPISSSSLWTKRP